MSAILELKKANCKNCYKCIRECPVKSIKFSENQANIINDECIYCGLCFVSCPQNAKLVRNDIPTAKRLINSGKKVYLSLAPSYIASFPVSGLEEMREAAKSLGFYDVCETAIGADIVKREYEKILNKKMTPVLISSCCHSLNLLIQKYYPQSLPYLASVMSPMLAHAKYLKEQEECYVVFAGPCVSKKHEQDTYGTVDCVLTFEELKEWFALDNVHVKENTQLDKTQLIARSFPIVGGIVRSMNRAEDITYMVVDGMDNCIAALKEIEQGGLTNCFIEMSACIGSCIGGPSISSPTRLKNYSRVKDYAGREDTVEYKLNSSLIKSIPFLGTNTLKPGESSINKILVKMGKTSPDKELNCGSCGYNTCREKAIAICEGKADLSMCLPFLKEKAESFSDSIIHNSPNAIIVMDEKLNIQQINESACSIFKLKDMHSVIGSQISRLISPIEYLNAIESESGISCVKQYISEYDIYVEESIVYDKDYHIIISIMKDISREQKENNQRHKLHQDTAEIADKVIEKQMRVVQEIASLLGETTAETKIALTKLKDALAK